MWTISPSEIIALFETYTDDQSELSTTEELALANRIYHQILDDRPWEFLKKEGTGAVATTYITLPIDFSHLIANNGTTDNTIGIENNAKPVAVYISGSPYQVINWSDRRQLSGNQCYVDLALNRIVFGASVSGTYSFDYIFVPDDLTMTAPTDLLAFPPRFAPIIAFGMATDNYILSIFDKAKSYANENQFKYKSILSDMVMWNSKFYMN